MADFTPCVAFVRAREGGYSDDPDDTGNWTGGAVGQGVLRGTMFGISAASYPSLDIAHLTPDQADAIYRADYWAKIDGDALPAGVDLMVLDHAVNCGVSASVKLLQDAVATRPDGVMGPITLGETAKRSPLLLIAALAEAQEIAYRKMATFPRYGKGWLNRLALRRQAATALLTAPARPAPAPPAAAAPPGLFAALLGFLASLMPRRV